MRDVTRRVPQGTPVIGVDWGTTSFRAFRLAEDGTVLDRRAAPRHVPVDVDEVDVCRPPVPIHRVTDLARSDLEDDPAVEIGHADVVRRQVPAAHPGAHLVVGVDRRRERRTRSRTRGEVDLGECREVDGRGRTQDRLSAHHG